MKKDKQHKDRYSGTFYTPKNWVDNAYKYIEKEFGSNWREEYVVWDCACGRFALTQDYKFKELYCSTLEQDDIDWAINNNINPEATRFQFDFLNGDFDTLPETLKDALNNKKVLFLINPPYATSATFTTEEGYSKKGVSKNKTNIEMLKDKFGRCSSQLFAQFMYNIYKLNKNNNINIAIYVKSIYKCGGSYKDFRKKWFNKFNYKYGMIFKASHFQGLSPNWAIDFSIWKSGTNINNSEFKVDVKDTINNKIHIIGEKVLYNLDNELQASKWVRQEVKGLKTYDFPQLSSALKVKQTGRGRRIKDSLGFQIAIGNDVVHNKNNICILSESSSLIGNLNINKENIDKINNHFCSRVCIESGYTNGNDNYIGIDNTGNIKYLGSLLSNANNICFNPTNVTILSENFRDANDISITNNNIEKSNNLFMARNINPDYINENDEYAVPIYGTQYELFTNDALIYSLFNNKSQQSSLRDVLYKDNIYQIKNEYFWLSKEYMAALGKQYNYTKLIEDVNNNNERFVYNKLNNLIISKDAKEILDMANNLINISIKERMEMDKEHPEYYLNTFDAGYAQLKLVWKKYFPVEFKAFRDKYKEFENRMIPQIYELGFLKHKFEPYDSPVIDE